jgi:hypothetical protein
MGRNRVDILGKKFGRLEVISFEGSTDGGIALWRVRCECGTEFVACSNNIRYGRTRSCGCLRKELTRERNGKRKD